MGGEADPRRLSGSSFQDSFILYGAIDRRVGGRLTPRVLKLPRRRVASPFPGAVRARIVEQAPYTLLVWYYGDPRN